MTTPLLTAGTNYVYHCKAEQLFRWLPDASIDLIVTDPPYGIQYASSRKTRMDGSQRTTSPSFGEDIFSADWLLDAARSLKEGGAIYLCTRWDVMQRWRDAIECVGLHVVQRIIWDKCHWGMGDLRYYGSQTEDILFAVKGEHKMRWGKREGNVWRIPSKAITATKDGFFDHPTQKPVELMTRMIVRSSDSDNLIVDPFCGSGTTLVAAQKHGRRFLGCDLEAKYVDIAQKRLAKPFDIPLFTEATA